MRPTHQALCAGAGQRIFGLVLRAPRLDSARIHLWSHLGDSNPGPTAYKAVALPTELRWHDAGMSINMASIIKYVMVRQGSP